MNIDLLRRVVKQIQDDPASWDQNDWMSSDGCKTTFCIAGWAVVLDGLVTDSGKLTERGAVASGPTYTPGTPCTRWSRLGRQALDLEPWEATALFSADGFVRVEHIWDYVENCLQRDVRPTAEEKVA